MLYYTVISKVCDNFGVSCQFLPMAEITGDSWKICCHFDFMSAKFENTK